MIVELDQCSITLKDITDNRRFKVAVRAPLSDFDAVKNGHRDLVQFDSPDIAWVSITGLKGWPDLRETESWPASVDAMVAAAVPYGWIDVGRGAIKAHVDWLAATTSMQQSKATTMPTSEAPTYDGDPSTNPREFRRCLGQFATGVTVVTATCSGEPIGMTVNSFASVSLDPPLILWSVDRATARYAQFAEARSFVINVLSDKQIATSRRFASSGPDKFKDIGWVAGTSGVPILSDTAAFFECDLVNTCDGGDHLILIGQVKRVAYFDRSVLLFSQGRYRIPADHPADTLQQTAQAARSSSGTRTRILSNLFRANHKLSFEFSRFRERMTRDEHRVAVALERNPDIDVDAIAKDTFLGAQATEDAVRTLLAEESICISDARKFRLTAKGVQQRQALNQKQVEMEKELLRDIPEAVVDAGEKLLAQLAGA